MAFQSGGDCKFYINSGSWDTPDWDDVGNVGDLRIMDEYDEDDMTRRGGNGVEEIIVTIRKCSVEFDLIYDPDDANHTALFAAYQTKASIEVAAMDGDITTNDKQGPHFVGKVTKFERPQELRKGCRCSLAIKPTPADDPFEWLVVGA